MAKVTLNVIESLPNHHFLLRLRYCCFRFGLRFLSLVFMKRLICLFVCLSCWLHPAVAGPLLPLSVQDLTEAADVVLQGKVLSRKVARDDDGRVFTSIQFQVQDVWKGEVAGDTFEVVHGGGILGLRKVEVLFQVEFALGEEAVVFCRINSKGQGVTIGMVQGKFDVLKSDYDSKLYVRNVFHGGAPPGSSSPQTRGIRLPHQLPLPIESLKAQVKGGVK